MSVGVSGANAEFERRQRIVMEMLLQMLKKMLRLDPEDRISLQEAMAEPFMQYQFDFT
jgi:hypothetical protein